MPLQDSNTKAFLAMVRAGLWEIEVRHSQFNDIEFSQVLKLAEEQSVTGLVTAGFEHVKDLRVPQANILQFISHSFQIEQRNQMMNRFAASLISRLRQDGINAILVKGQGVAQCYERPLWRTSGDIDLLLDCVDYRKAKNVLSRYSVVDSEDEIKMHLAMNIDSWIVELHGYMPFSLSKKADKVIDDVIKDTLDKGGVRVWKNEETDIFLPNVDNDIVLVFTHFLHHFFIEGVGLRQICDWCRLLWTYRSEINTKQLEDRLRMMGLLTEWKVFAALAVDTLGMPEKTMPLFDVKFRAKGEKVLMRVLKSGNFGHNNDLSYRVKYKGMAYNVIAVWRRFIDFVSLAPVFPMDSLRFFVRYLINKVK